MIIKQIFKTLLILRKIFELVFRLDKVYVTENI